jgi:prepilin-type N-terminal cleavage/methylation domain-containing protein
MPARPRKRRLRAPARPDSGFTLVELMVALLLLAIIMTASLYAILQGLGLSRDSNNRVVASTIASGVLEKLRSQSLTTSGFGQIPVTTQTLTPQTVQGATYNLVQDVEWVPRGTNTTSCNSASNASFVLRATVTATWGTPGVSVVDSTMIAPPNGTFSSTDGALGVQLTSSSGAPLSGVTVSVAGQSAQGYSPPSITTGSDGCAFFAQLPQDTYNVTYTDPTYVNPSEQLSPFTTTAGVNATQIQTLSLSIDVGGTISWSYSPTSPAPATGMPISIDHPGQFPYNLYPYTNVVGSSGTLTNVYPGTYQSIFAGGCTDADPDGLDTTGQPLYPNASPSSIVVGASPVSAVIPLYPLNLQVTNSAGAPITNAYSPTSPTLLSPTAVAGNGSCPSGSPPYTLNPFPSSPASGLSSTGVGLGELAISVTVTVPGSPTRTERGTVSVWVKPDGVYNASGSTLLYSFASGGSVPVPVS